jgi:hypothetical protein
MSIYMRQILRGTIFTNINAIILLLYSNKYFKHRACVLMDMTHDIIPKIYIELVQILINILPGTIFTNINAIIRYYTMSMGSLIFMDVCTRS